jgi:RNA polymerase sigma factor (sigma-70 family)
METGNTATNDSLRTRESLLGRLQDLDDQDSWRVFFDRYWRLLYNVARRSGLDEACAQDVVQETVIAAARGLPGFRYDPQRGTFKQWLLRITRRRIVDHLRRAYREPPRSDLPPEMLEESEGWADAVTHPSAARIAEDWEEEWRQSVFDAAVAAVRQEANPKHFQVFDYCVLKGWPVSRVSATLGLNAAQVYLAKHRVSQAVKRAARRLDAVEAAQ